jgi:membrane-associated phospholipid phosphatase
MKYMPAVAEETGRAAGKSILIALAAAIAALGLFAWLAEQVLDGGTIAFDQHIRLFLHQQASPSLTAAMRFFTDFGSPAGILALSAGALAGLWLSRWKRGIVLFLITMAGAGVLDAVLKTVFHRPRPPVSYFATPIPGTYGFPSGHALFFLCFFGVLAALATSRIHNLAVRIAIWFVACGLTGMIGLSRIYLGVHYPSDVLAGYAAGTVWLIVVLFGGRIIERRQRTRRPHGG